MTHILNRTFRRGDWADLVVEKALADQEKFEGDHGVIFSPDQRRQAVVQRCVIIAREHGARLLPDFTKLVDAALRAKETT